MFEEILEGSPIGKWQEIVFNANKSVVNDELERLLECLALYQEFVNLEGLEDKFAQFARLLGCDEELQNQEPQKQSCNRVYGEHFKQK